MATVNAGWKARARNLADTLRAHGDINDPRWHAAIAAIPRHRLVPIVYQQVHGGVWTEISTSTAQGLDLAYSPTTLVVALAEHNGYQEAVSSSTKPDLMVRMLELLDIHEGHCVLEIGTGTGYNAALLARRLGDRHVFSIDIRSELIERARRRLADLGYRPTLVSGDGEQGLSAYAPFDRILATCAVPRIPWAWVERTRHGGLILADLKLGISAGNLVLLRRTRDGAEGSFSDRWAVFMNMRHDQDGPKVRHDALRHAADQAERRYARTEIGAFPWQEKVPWFLAQLDLPQGVTFGYTLDPATNQPSAGFVTAPDGSHAHIPVGGSTVTLVTETGPTPLWEPIRDAYRTWHSTGRPDWPRLGMTVGQHAQTLWLDHPDSQFHWSLPSRGDDQAPATGD